MLLSPQQARNHFPKKRVPIPAGQGCLKLDNEVDGHFTLHTDRSGGLGNDTVGFNTADITKASCSPALTSTSAVDLYHEIMDKFFNAAAGNTGDYQLTTPTAVTAVLGGDDASVDVGCAAVPYAMTYHAQIATNAAFTAGMLEATSASLPINVPDAVPEAVYYSRIQAKTTNPGNTDSAYAVAAVTVEIPEA